jgi:hypothetical protein
MSICGRSKDKVLKQCPDVLPHDYTKLVLDKDPNLSGLKYIALVMVGALALPIIGFATARVARTELKAELVGKLGADGAGTAAILLSFGSLTAAAYLIIMGSRLLTRKRLDLRQISHSHT